MQHLRKQRMRLGLSQSRLGRLSHVSRFKINQHELGGKQLTAEEQGRIEAIIAREAAQLVAHVSQLLQKPKAMAAGELTA